MKDFQYLILEIEFCCIKYLKRWLQLQLWHLDAEFYMLEIVIYLNLFLYWTSPHKQFKYIL